MKKLWKKTHDIYGHAINFRHTCSSCGHDKMILRYSQLFEERSRVHGLSGPTNEMAFKCERCSLVDRFLVPTTEQYIKKILKLRKDDALYLPPKEVWEKESEEIRRRLEALGYF